MEEKTIDRRDFLKKTGLVVGGVVGGGIVGSLVAGTLKPAEIVTETKEVEKVVEKTVEHVIDYNQALQYFTKEQFDLVDAAMERIFPKDSNSPGAKDLGAAYFIDHQLASSYGVNGKSYMSGPFLKGEPTQGSQTHLYRQQIYDIGIRGIENWSIKKYNKSFVKLSEAEQDEVLTALQKGEVDTLVGIAPQEFFSLLRSNTFEGVYSDPVYGGNRDMGGWKLKKYPGAQMSYAPFIDQDKTQEIKPISLKDHMRH